MSGLDEKTVTDRTTLVCRSEADISTYIDRYGKKDLETLTILNTVTFSDDSTHVFSFCRALKTLVIEDGVAMIPKYAFLLCPLTSVEFPKNTPITVYNCAFSYCDSRSLTIPRTVKLVGERIFTGCKYLETIIVDDIKANLIDTKEKLQDIFDRCPLKKIITDDQYTADLFRQVYPEINIQPTKQWIAESESRVSQHLDHPGLEALLEYMYELDPMSEKKKPSKEMEGGGVRNIFSKYHNNRTLYHRMVSM